MLFTCGSRSHAARRLFLRAQQPAFTRVGVRQPLQEAKDIRIGVVGAGANTRLHHIPKLK